jgi:hypothetical protein
MAERVQSYAKHARWFPPFHFFVIPVLFVNVLVSAWHLSQVPALDTVFQLVVAVALLTLGLTARAMAIVVQDRLIRLEMRLRLREVLPAALHNRIEELTHRQLVALRFASDGELTDLVRDVLDGKLATSKEIKMRVKNWQADWLRA